MKTLDEVIKGLELCTSSQDCLGYECPYWQEGSNCDLVAIPKMQDDALHYLKEYRETVTNCHQLRKGTWIPVDSETVNGRCSVCGYESRLYENDVYGEHYCPNCGAWLRLT